MPEKPTQEESEEKVLEAVKEWLPSVLEGQVVTIRAAEPGREDGARFCVNRTRTFVCRRGS